MIDQYKIFVGKVCTVLTTEVSFPIADPLAASQYFTGLVTDVNQYGIWIKQLQTGLIGFFSFPVVGMVEEQYVPPSDPKHEEIKEEINKIKNPPPKNFTSVSDLTKMAKEIKKRRDNT